MRFSQYIPQIWVFLKKIQQIHAKFHLCPRYSKPSVHWYEHKSSQRSNVAYIAGTQIGSQCGQDNISTHKETKTAQFLMKLTFAQQRFVKTFNIQFHENQTRSLVTAIESIQNERPVYKVPHCTFLAHIYKFIYTYRGYAVAQLVEALRYKSEGRGLDSRWCHCNFSLT